MLKSEAQELPVYLDSIFSPPRKHWCGLEYTFTVTLQIFLEGIILLNRGGTNNVWKYCAKLNLGFNRFPSCNHFCKIIREPSYRSL